MKNFWFCLLFTLFLVSIEHSLEANEKSYATLSKREMIENIDVIKQMFEVNYACAEWKRDNLGWNLEKEVEDIKQKISQCDSISLKTYQRWIRDLFNSAKDYHVNVKFFSTEKASLPFAVRLIGEKYLVIGIDQKKLSFSAFSISVGDELVLFDGRPVDEVILKLKKEELIESNSETDQIYAESLLTNRWGKFAHYVPSGPIFLTFKSLQTGAIQTVQLIWDYTPENLIVDHSSRKEGMEYSSIPKKGFLPLLAGDIFWQTEESNPFHAYIYHDRNGRRIGYVHLPHYSLEKNEIEQFGLIIQRMEKETEGLIIDQQNNMGGKVMAAYVIASMLTPHAIPAPKHRFMMTSGFLWETRSMLKKLQAVGNDEEAKKVIENPFCGYPVNYQVAQFYIQFCYFILEQWEKGNFLTDSHYVLGVDCINPHPIYRYTKPVLLLNNALCMSSADIFAAIVQDNGLGVLMGTRTMGAGGSVKDLYYHNRFGIQSISLTQSIAERADGRSLETLGVHPDISYKLTEDDICNRYLPFVEAIHQAMDDLLK